MEDPTDELQETLAKVVDPVSVLKLTLEPVVPAPVVLNTSVLSPGGIAPLSLVLVGQVWSLTQYLFFVVKLSWRIYTNTTYLEENGSLPIFPNAFMTG